MHVGVGPLVEQMEVGAVGPRAADIPLEAPQAAAGAAVLRAHGEAHQRAVEATIVGAAMDGSLDRMERI